MKLTLEQIAPYIAYDLEVYDTVSKTILLVDDSKYIPTCIKEIFNYEKPERQRISIFQTYMDEKIKPILRPLSQLTQEITHKGYNDDKPFIPIVELCKIWHTEIKNCRLRKCEHRYKTVLFDLNNKTYEFNYNWSGHFIAWEMDTDIYLPVIRQNKLFEQLIKWHFFLGDQSLFEKGILIEKK